MKSSNWKIVKTKPLRRNERSIGLEQIKTQNVLYIPLAAGLDYLTPLNWELKIRTFKSTICLRPRKAS